MSVLLETSLGDLVVDLEIERCPRTCNNFLKLCAAYKYNHCTFFSVQKNFLAQTGDPSNSGQGGSSIFNLLPSSSQDYSSEPYFIPERHTSLKHNNRGTLSMALSGRYEDEDENDVEHSTRVAGSQFFIALADDVEYLNGKHAPFGTVVEGQEPDGTLDKINSSFVDNSRRPLRDIRVRHVVILDDPFPPLEGLEIPSRTPSPTPEQLASVRLDASEEIVDNSERPPEEVEEEKRKADSSTAALTLEMVGDLPFAEVRPPENILFVCKLNPVTRSEDLELIFSRFGKIMSCDVIRDKKTGDSLQYAFIEFDKKEQAEQAYFKMQNVLVDDRRIWVDFSQSVSRLHGSWLQNRGAGGRSGKGSRDRNGDAKSVTSPPGRAAGMIFDFDEIGDDRGSSAGRRQKEEYRRDGKERERKHDRERGHGRSGEGDTHSRHHQYYAREDRYHVDPHRDDHRRDDRDQRRYREWERTPTRAKDVDARRYAEDGYGGRYHSQSRY